MLKSSTTTTAVPGLGGVADDAAAIIAYLKGVPPVDKELPATEVRPLGRVLSAFAFDPAAEMRTDRPPVGNAPPPAATAEYGEYLASTMCVTCHGPDLRGDENPPGPPGTPPAPDLVAVAAEWTPDGFRHALRTGVTPDGRELDRQYMPWTFTAALDDHEIDGLYAYLASLGGTAGLR